MSLNSSARITNTITHPDILPTPSVYVPLTSARHLPTSSISAHGLPTSPSNINTSSKGSEKQSPVVSKYAQYLRAEYDNILGSLPDKLPFTLGNEYVRLTVVKNEVDTQAKADEFLGYRGDVNKILAQKKEIEVDDILQPGENTRLVLIEGEPGIGKSTLAVELCHQWQNHRLLQQFSLVVLLRLREETVKFARDIKDFYFHPDETFRDHLVDEIKESLGKNILLIFDGFDEFPIELRQKSLVMDMIKGTKYLPEATILVTSRPSALAVLQPLLRSTSSKHIEIVGFTEESIYKAAFKVFDDPELFSNFSTYLSANPVVKAIMYNPLNSAIVLNMYKQNSKTGRPIPHTLTQLYTELSRSLISSYLSGIGHPLARVLPENLKEFPKELYFQLLKISELAYNGTVKDNKEIFEKLPENCSSGLGLLIEYRSLFSVSETVKYIFFHKSLQEYLSAFYISQQDLVKQRVFIASSLPYLTSVVKFIAGLTKIKEVGWGTLVDKPLLFTFFHEAHNLENCIVFLDHEKRHIEIFIDLTGYEIYALGYTISTCGKSWNLTLPLTTVVGLEMFGHGLKYNKNNTGSIHTLNLLSSHGNIRHFFKIMPSPILRKIENLTLINCNLTEEDFQNLALGVPELPSLKTLMLSHNPGGSGSLVGIMQSLKPHRRIKHLSMYDVDIGMEDVAALSDLIKSSSSLKWLRVGRVFSQSSIRDEDAKYIIQQELVKTVLSPSSLVNVEIVLQPIHDSVSVIMEGVDELSNRLESLSLYDPSPLSESYTFSAERLWQLLSQSKSLKQLTLILKLSQQDIENMIQWLKDNDLLETLQLSEDNKISLLHKVLDPRIKYVKSA